MSIEKLAFRVSWSPYYTAYTVSIPSYDGGEVVRLEHVQPLAEIAKHAKLFMQGDEDGANLSRLLADYEKQHGEL